MDLTSRRSRRRCDRSARLLVPWVVRSNMQAAMMKMMGLASERVPSGEGSGGRCHQLLINTQWQLGQNTTHCNTDMTLMLHVVLYLKSWGAGLTESCLMTAYLVVAGSRCAHVVKDYAMFSRVTLGALHTAKACLKCRPGH